MNILDVKRVLECPRCHSEEWKYVESKDGRLLVVSLCGWELCEMRCDDDLDVALKENEDEPQRWEESP